MPCCFLCCLVSAALVLVLAGCSEDEAIRAYVVPKQPEAGSVWFFKLVGPESAVVEVSDEMREFAKSVNFDEKTGTPEWTLPEDWAEKPSESAFRYRTIVIPGTPPLEIAVSHVAGRVPLPQAEIESHADLLREQAGETSSENGKRTHDKGIETITAGGRTGRLFDFSGETTRFGKTRLLAAMIAVPFAPKTATAEAPQREVPFTYETPEGWREAPQTQFSVVSLSAGEGANAASVTVTPAFGDLLANINRWRGQAGLDSISTEEMPAHVEKITVDGLEAQITEAIGEDRAIVGAVMEGAGGQWFLKLDGVPEVVKAQRESFRKFVESMKFK
jgi:hypothetical protein